MYPGLTRNNFLVIGDDKNLKTEGKLGQIKKESEQNKVFDMLY